MYLTWTEQLSVGNLIVDTEHRNLMSVVGDVADAIRDGRSPALMRAFDLPEQFLSVHFEHEEEIARVIKFPFGQHKLAQQYSLKELQLMRDELVDRDGIWPDGAVEHFSQSLKKWMIDDHIIKRDMLMKPVLQKLDYGFWPGLA